MKEKCNKNVAIKESMVINKSMAINENKMQRTRGITLIALVITIIILLILAGTSISIIVKDDGIFKVAHEAAEKTKIENYREVLGVIGSGLMQDKLIGNIGLKGYMDKYEERIKKERTFKNAREVKRVAEGEIKVVTEEGYVFRITDKGVEYLGKQGENPLPELTEADIIIDPNPKDPTKGDVTVTIETKLEGYRIEYTKGNPEEENTWEQYNAEEKITMETNGTIYARLRNELEEVTNWATGAVTNIDKLKPKDFSINGESIAVTTNSMTVKGKTEDEPATDEYMSSGISEYYFSKDGSTWEPKDGVKAGQDGYASYTFTNLTQGQEYTIRMKAVDVAGNEKETTEAVKKSTTKVPGNGDKGTDLQKPAIEFTYTPSTLTKENVTVGIINNAGSQYTLEYTLETPSENTKWVEYTAETKISKDKNGNVYARLKDSTNQVGTNATGTVTNIDKLMPKSFNASVTSTTNSITVKGKTEDEPATSEYKSSGISKYYFSKNGTTWEGPVNAPANNADASYTFNGLAQGTQYTIKMKAVDGVGNERETSVVNISTTKVPGNGDKGTDGKTGAITFIYTPSTLTKGDVTVEIKNNAGTQYTLEYKESDPNAQTGWTKYTGKITKKQNGYVYARLKDSTNQAGTYATGTVSNIDKLVPTAFTPSATSTKDSITVRGHTTDQVQTSANASSGMSKYYFSKNGTTWEPTNGVTAVEGQDASYTFPGLTAGTSYTLKMKAVDKVGNETIGTVTKGTLSAPVVTTVAYKTKDIDRITVTATATDKDGGNLTYTLKAGTSASNLNKVSSSVTKASGQAVDLTVTGLSQYTTYYYTVEVKDTSNYTGSKAGPSTVRTMCSGTTKTCPGGTRTQVNCGNCGGDGKIAGTVKDSAPCTACGGKGTITGICPRYVAICRIRDGNVWNLPQIIREQ